MGGYDGHRRRGAAILIAVAAAMIVMLAVGVLFTLMDRMISGQLKRERDIQISLSEASALDALVHSVSSSGPLDPGSSRTYELAGVTTVLTASAMESAGPRRSGYTIGGDAVPHVVPSGRSLFVFTPENGVTVSVFSGDGGERVGSFRLGLSASHISSCPARWDAADAAVLVLGAGSVSEVVVVTREGVAHRVQAPIPGLNPWSVLTFGNSGSTPLLVVSGGGNQGTVVDLLSGSASGLISPAGTCPAITPSGEVFGRPSDPGVFTLAPPVREFFSGDFNRDGREDLAWAGPRSLFCLTSSGLHSGSPAPDAVLNAWGSIEGNLGLGARWSLPDGSTVWTRLNNDGFGVFQPTGALEYPWNGRFFGRGTVMTGTFEGEVLLASIGGGSSLVILGGDRFVWGDADGLDVDVFAPGPGGVQAVFNPLSGDGTSQVIQARSSLDGNGTTSSYRLLLYNGPPRWRVFIERDWLAGQ